jgi:hypothetical protein
MSAKTKRDNQTIIIVAIIIIVAVVIVFIQSLGNSKTNKFPPYQSNGYTEQTTDDERVRYILVDIQLGGVQNYYRQYQNEDPNIQRALSLWDKGVRIVNIYQFNRVDLGNEGWQVVYGGTVKVVNSSDIVLTEDIGATGNDEARIRYIIADAQLGNVVDYYRQYTSDSVTNEAVKRWDSGIRVVNINQFQRIIVAQAGWQVVYSGTTDTINGMDVILTNETNAQESSNNGGSNTACDSNNEEARILYILADIQISGASSYYAQFPNDPYAVEALKRWNSGTRVGNPDDFERKIVGDKGWQIVYARTDTTICGIDVKTLFVSPNPLENPPSENINYCGNSYWPIKQGATWAYYDGLFGETRTWRITTVNGQAMNATFVVNDQSNFGSNNDIEFICNENGIFRNGLIYLPPERELQPGLHNFSDVWVEVSFDKIRNYGGELFPTLDIKVGACEGGEGEGECDIYGFTKNIGVAYFKSDEDAQNFIIAEYAVP